MCNVQVECCPTDEMEADYMSKPLQGTKFAKHRGTLMNIGEPTNVEASKPMAIKAAKSVTFGQVVYHEIEARQELLLLHCVRLHVCIDLYATHQ